MSRNFEPFHVLRAVEERQEPYTQWSTNTKMPGWVIVGDVDVLISWTAIRFMAKRALRSKGKACTSGPVQVKVRGKPKTTELPIQPDTAPCSTEA